ncbi:MAG: methyltransferase domain-containing protein [Candidatus Woesearchaeota archaeon]
MTKLLRFLYHKVYVRIFPSYHIELENAIENCETILDVGCGTLSPLKFIRKRKSMGVDAHLPSIMKSKMNNIHDKYINCDVMKIDKKFKECSFDCVVALDLIEHLKKKDGYKLIKKMERIAKKKVIIYTPNGFLSQKSLEGNPYQKHRSGWHALEFQKMGYKVIGIHGLKSLRGELAEPKYRPKWLWFVISDITQKFVRNKPEKAFQLLCIKEMKR